MILFLGIIAVVLLALGEMFVIAAAGTFKRGLDWTDFAALIGPLLAMLMTIVFFLLLSGQIALVLSFAIVALTIWGIGFLLKFPAKRRAQ
jgi:hypothetical protein